MTIDGGSGDDEIEAIYTEYATLFGRQGDDVLSFGYNNGDAYGGVGNDELSVLGDSGTLYGEDGDDFLEGSLFSDSFGGDGNDILYFGNSGDGGAGSDYVGAASSRGGSGDDVVSGESAYGDEGSDFVAGYTFARGGAGNDVVFGGIKEPDSEFMGATGGTGRGVFFSVNSEFGGRFSGGG